MKYVLAFQLANVFLGIIICWTTLRITIRFKRKETDELFKVHVQAWFGLIRLQLKVPAIQLADDFPGMQFATELESPQEALDQKKEKINPQTLFQFQKRIRSVRQRIHELHQIMKKFLKTIRVERFEWVSEIGTGDAAETGVLTGICWGVKTSILGLIRSFFTLNTMPRVLIHPDFQHQTFETEVVCMMKMRIGQAILAGLRILLNLRKRRDNKWQSTLFKA